MGTPVPQGRLNLAQNASPGWDVKGDSVPQGRLKMSRETILENFQMYPGLASWLTQWIRPLQQLIDSYGGLEVTVTVKPDPSFVRFNFARFLTGSDTIPRGPRRP